MQSISNQTIQSLLCGIEKPGRYSGGEFGSGSVQRSAVLYTGISYPDLYEIGMSNNAVRILYGMLNHIEGVVCERVFAPAPDFEAALIRNEVPLFTLESRYVLSELQVLAFSIGYELTFTNIFTILERGGIPLENTDRGEHHPIVIAGGPASINPVPYGKYVDGVWIGESEKVLPEVVTALAQSRYRGAQRGDMLNILAECPHIWMKGKKEAAVRGVWNGFGCELIDGTGFFPIPTVRTVQAQGVVEIMRGCPNGCRFCNAGSIYKPVREKSIDIICKEIDSLVFRHGLREITLSSLSSGDYSRIHELMQIVNKRYQGLHVSFSLPSLKVDSFTFDLLQEISKVRKSGLTFAVETPESEWQRGINKRVAIEKIIEILTEAKGAGWKLAKFYFMLGLPASEESAEADKIIAFINSVHAEVKMSLNVNIGTFVPKPHTPFQWSKQLTDEQSIRKMVDIKNAFRNRPIKINYQSPFLSMLEGVVSRGDERGGELFLKAYKRGARLDAWEEYLDKALWADILAASAWDVAGETCRERRLEEKLPWDSVDMGISKGFLKQEYRKALAGEETDRCEEDCGHNCGVCGDDTSVSTAGSAGTEQANIPDVNIPDAEYCSYLFGFSKTDRAVYVSHLDVLRMLEHTFQRAGVFVRFTQGFNPKPRLEFAHPLSLGIASLEEIGMGEFRGNWESNQLMGKLNRCIPDGFSITNLKKVLRREGEKKRSLMSLYWGAEYRVEFHKNGNEGPIIEAVSRIESFIDSESDYAGCYSYQKAGDGFSIRIRNMNKKETSLNYLMREIADIRDSCTLFSITRTKLFGNKGGEPFDYFSLL